MTIFSSLIAGGIGGILAPITDLAKAYINKQISEKEFEAKVTQSLVETLPPLFDAQQKIIVAEMQSEHWLVRSWRPIVVLTSFFSYFYVIVLLPHFAIWHLYGTNENGTPVVPRFGEAGLENLFWITATAITAYIGGRTVEKVTQTISNKWSKS